MRLLTDPVSRRRRRRTAHVAKAPRRGKRLLQRPAGAQRQRPGGARRVRPRQAGGGRPAHFSIAGEALLAPSVTRRLIAQFAARPDPRRRPAELDELTEANKRSSASSLSASATPTSPGASSSARSPPRPTSAGPCANSAAATAPSSSPSPTKAALSCRVPAKPRRSTPPDRAHEATPAPAHPRRSKSAGERVEGSGPFGSRRWSIVGLAGEGREVRTDDQPMLPAERGERERAPWGALPASSLSLTS